MKKLAAEAFGTFSLVFAGTGAIVINDISGGTITHVGVALAFGLVVLAMIYAVGDVSGRHLNPAVTLGFFAARGFPASHVAPYIVCQCVGAGLASLTLRALFPTHPTLGATLPAGSAAQSFVMETILAMILMFVILSVSSGSKEKGLLAGVAVGAVIALEALFAGPVSGASMNPARSPPPSSPDDWNICGFTSPPPSSEPASASSHAAASRSRGVVAGTRPFRPIASLWRSET